MTSAQVRRLAHECGFELAGIASAEPNRDAARFLDWASRGLAGEMGYLSDRRAGVRTDPKQLLPAARSVVCAGKFYNTPLPYSTEFNEPERAWISRYAWGDDYHDLIRDALNALVARMREFADFEYRICVDTAPLLERSCARDAGLGWIGKNTCLIHQYAGSWFFLGEVITTLDLESGTPAENRCGTCTRCIDACPTDAILPNPAGGFELDSRLCISCLTIELRGTINEALRAGVGRHVFGCDICQDVCPWNRRAAFTLESAFKPRDPEPDLERFAALDEEDFRRMFRHSPVARAKYRGFLRNVAVAMGNSRAERFRQPLERLAGHADETVAEHARWALRQLRE